MPGSQQLFGHHAADIAGRARHQDFHALSLFHVSGQKLTNLKSETSNLNPEI
jgi:hypothetical protein